MSKHIIYFRTMRRGKLRLNFFSLICVVLFGAFIFFANVFSEPLILPPPSADIIEKWKKFHHFTAKGLTDFVSENLSPQIRETPAVFYPFGGADVIYPLLLYPKAKDIILVGLEFPGEELGTYKEDTTSILPQITSLLRRSFFVTTQMNQQFSQRNGVVPVILLQLSLLNIDKVDIGAPDLPYPGIKI